MLLGHHIIVTTSETLIYLFEERMSFVSTSSGRTSTTIGSVGHGGKKGDDYVRAMRDIEEAFEAGSAKKK